MFVRLAVSSLAVSGALAQALLPTELFGLSFSAQCQAAVIGVLSTGDFATCFPAAGLLPALMSNESIVLPLDDFMSDLCYSQPCSDATLSAAAQAVTAGCSSDLQQDGFSDSVVSNAFQAYPVVREILCTKTSDYYTEESYGGFLGAPPIPIDGMTYNSTDGYFCVTSVLTQLSAYFGTELTVPFISSIVSGDNSTALNLVKTINPNVICNDCIFATFDILGQAVPALADVTVDSIFGALNMTSPAPAGTTLVDLAEGTCAYQNRTVTTDGTLPESVTVSIVNSTFTPA